MYHFFVDQNRYVRNFVIYKLVTTCERARRLLPNLSVYLEVSHAIDHRPVPLPPCIDDCNLANLIARRIPTIKLE